MADLGAEHPACGSRATRWRSRPGSTWCSAEIAKKYTNNLGYPGYTNAAIDEVFNKFLIPQMFAEVAQGKRTPADAARDLRPLVPRDLPELAEPREDLSRLRAALITELGRPPQVGEAPEPVPATARPSRCSRRR